MQGKESEIHPNTLSNYESQFLLHDFIFQTSFYLYENTPEMAFNDNFG